MDEKPEHDAESVEAELELPSGLTRVPLDAAERAAAEAAAVGDEESEDEVAVSVERVDVEVETTGWALVSLALDMPVLVGPGSEVEMVVGKFGKSEVAVKDTGKNPPLCKGSDDES